jgi:hypothetical protein
MNDLPGLISSSATLLTVVGSLGIQIFNLIRSGKRDQKIAEVHDLVNGQSEVLKTAVKAVAFAEGKEAGIASETARKVGP